MPALAAPPLPTQTHELFTLAAQPGEHFVQLPQKTVDGIVYAHARQTIQAEPEALYQLWRHVSLIPRWQERVISVTPVSDRVSHWIMGDPDAAEAQAEQGKEPRRVEFDSEIHEDIPGHRLAWRTVSGDVHQSGEVVFHARRDGRGTVVTLIEAIEIPGGALGNAAAGISRRSPRQTVIENLRHFKQLVETGEIPTVKGQSHGPRGLSGGIKEWMAGETNPTPPGTTDLA